MKGTAGLNAKFAGLDLWVLGVLLYRLSNVAEFRVGRIVLDARRLLSK